MDGGAPATWLMARFAEPATASAHRPDDGTAAESALLRRLARERLLARDRAGERYDAAGGLARRAAE
jgi:hypothetical protein